MSFILRKDVEKWFVELKNTPAWAMNWDLYYFCLMAGLAAGRKSVPKKGGRNASEVTRQFPGEYNDVSKELIIGLLIFAELKSFAVDLSDKDQVRKIIKGLIQQDKSTKLTDKGTDRLNEYASGGFDILIEKSSSKPYAAEDFLCNYPELLEEILKETPFCGKK